MQRWLAAIPAGIASSRPRLLLARSRLALAGGRVEAAGQLLDAAERAQAGAAAVEGEPFGPSADRGSWLVNVPAAVMTQRAYLAALRGDAEGAAAFASQALAAELLVSGVQEPGVVRLGEPVRAENLIRSCDLQSCSACRPAVMITSHVPAVRLPPGHADGLLAAAVSA